MVGRALQMGCLFLVMSSILSWRYLDRFGRVRDSVENLAYEVAWVVSIHKFLMRYLSVSWHWVLIVLGCASPLITPQGPSP